MTTTRTLAAALAVAALAVPAAQAKPVDMNGPAAQARSQAQQRQDLRSADARDAAVHPRRPAGVVNAPGATAVDSATRPAPQTSPGAPTWPVNPQPIAPAPVAEVSDGGNGVDWTTIGLGIAGSLLAVSGIAALNSRRSRRLRRLRVTV